jgi:carbon starvation protein
VACGACSGFHGIVSSGTTSKQIAKETDCRVVGYGGMLLEGLVAVIALATVMVLSKNDALAGASPDRIYAEGLARFVQHLGIPKEFARAFTMLAFTTFIYDTLDVATRLARYIFQELTGWKGSAGRAAATFLTLLVPLICVTLTVKDAAGNVLPAWKVFWTIFGTSNQLLAAITLMALSIWLSRLGKSWWMSAVPMAFLMVMTVWSLVLMVMPAAKTLFAGAPVFDLPGIIAFLLLALVAVLVFEAVKFMKRTPSAKA